MLSSPFLLCGSKMRPCRMSTSSQRKPRISDLLIPVLAASVNNRLEPVETCFNQRSQFTRLQISDAARR